MVKKLYLTIIIMLLLAPSVFAQIEKFDLDFTISAGKAYVVQNILFSKLTEFKAELPDDASEISVNADGTAYPADNTSFSINAKEIQLSYLTRQFIDNNNFVMDLTYPQDIENLSISLNIPSNLELARPVEENFLSSNAIFPKASLITTDGQRIKIYWEKTNVKAGDSISIFVMLRERKDYSYLFYIAAAAIAISVIILFVRKQKVKTIIKTRTAKIEEHLKEDEEQVVKILKSRENQCEQGTLRVVTGFSKAKLSGLLMELEERKIIYKEKKGKKNIIFLK